MTNEKKPISTDYYLSCFRWYRKLRRCVWHKHQFTNDGLELTMSGTFWALYGKINRYSDVIEYEDWS